MRRETILPLVLVLAAGGAFVVASQEPGEPPLPELSENPFETPIELIEAHPFRLLDPEPNTVRLDAPAFDQGWLLVLETESERLVRRQTFEHVLFVGDEPVQRFNNGDRSGRVVVTVPGPLDLSQAPAFFGEPELPERLTPNDRAAQLAAAVERGVRPFSADAIAEAAVPTVELADGYELGRYASYLIERHAPDEVDVVLGLRAPLIGR